MTYKRMRARRKPVDRDAAIIGTWEAVIRFKCEIATSLV